MRWTWIDSFVELTSKERAIAIKAVPTEADYLDTHIPGYPLFPPTLMIEGMAQTAGILVGEAGDFKANVILAKVKIAEIDSYAVPGDVIKYETQIESFDERGAATSGLVFINDENAGRINLIFSHVEHAQNLLGLPERNFVFGEPFTELIDEIRRKK